MTETKNPWAATQGEKTLTSIHKYDSSIPLSAWQVAQHFGLKPDAHKRGYIGQCPLCQYKGTPFAVGEKNGQLLMYCHACQSKEIFNFVIATLRPANSDTKSDNSAKRNPESVLAHANSMTVGGTTLPKGPMEENERKRQKAFELYKESIPTAGTIAEVYFYGRGFRNHWGPNLWIPEMIRLHPFLWYSSAESYPALVAPITDWQGRFMAIHRTYLAPDGKTKAPVDIPKKVYGPCRGGAIHFGEVGEVLALAEGLETAWAAMTYCAETTWACISTGGLEAVELPPLPLASTVLIFADNDANGAGLRSARRAEERFLLEGRRVEIIVPSRTDCDFADLLLEGGL